MKQAARPKSASLTPRRFADWRWLLVALLAGLGAYAATSFGLFYYGSVWQIPLFVGCVVGLVSAAPLSGAIVAPTVMAIGMLTMPPLLPATGQGALEWALALILSSGAAAGLGYARTAWAGSGKRFSLIASTVLVVWAVTNMWLPLFSAGVPVRAYGLLPSTALTQLPQAGQRVDDDAIYRRVFYSMHAGTPYYPAFRDAFSGRPAPASVMAFRLPTIFWLWRLLPPDAFSIVYLYLAICSVGAFSAAAIAGQLAGSRFAPLAAVAMASYVMGVGLTTYVTYVDLPAMSVALLGVAFFVRAVLAKDRRFLWAAAGVMTVAALTREILVYLPVLAALAALLEKPGRRWSAAMPLVAALGVFGLGYAAHAVAARPYLTVDSVPFSVRSGSLVFASRALSDFSNALNGHWVVLASFFVLGVLGAYAAHRRAGWPFTAFALAALVAPMLVMTRYGNSAVDAEGRLINYWGMLVVPLALSLWPAWALVFYRKAS